MSDNVADGLLLDVREVSLADLEVADLASTGLDLALKRLLSSSTERSFNSFNSAIIPPAIAA